jgi:hypothetical protein
MTREEQLKEFTATMSEEQRKRFWRWYELVMVAATVAVIAASPVKADPSQHPPKPAPKAAASSCVDASVPQAAIAVHSGKWIELSGDQWQFLRGIYVMNPLTPPGLPYGDKAVLAKVPGDKGGVVFFIDDKRACTPMPVPDELLKLMDDVVTGTIAHEGQGL